MNNTNYLLLALSLIVTLTYGLIRNVFCKKIVKTITDNFIFNAVSSLISALVLFAFSILNHGITEISAYTFILGALFGIITALSAISNMQALHMGPMSYTSLIVTSSMIIPALSGAVLFGEYVAVFQIIGIVLMVISLFLAIDRKNDDKSKSFKWLFMCVVCLIFTGSVGVLQKIHQNSQYKDESSAFLIIAFIFSAIFSLVFVFFTKKNGEKKPRCHFPSSFIASTMIMAIVSGIMIAAANKINLYLAGEMDSIIFYPIVNGAGLLLSVSAAVIIFRERPSKSQWAGIAVGSVAVLLLCNIF